MKRTRKRTNERTTNERTNKRTNEQLEVLFLTHKHMYEVLRELWLDCQDEQTMTELRNAMYDELNEAENIRRKLNKLKGDFYYEY